MQTSEHGCHTRQPAQTPDFGLSGFALRGGLWNSERDVFISLTDIAKLKDSDNPRYIIQNWLRNRNTIEFLGVWESLYNPSFNRVEFDAFRSQAGLNSFVMTPQKWVE